MISDDYTMPFGKHKGERIGEVPASYLLWLFEQDDLEQTRPQLFEYISEHEEALYREKNKEVA